MHALMIPYRECSHQILLLYYNLFTTTATQTGKDKATASFGTHDPTATSFVSNSITSVLHTHTHPLIGSASMGLVTGDRSGV